MTAKDRKLIQEQAGKLQDHAIEVYELAFATRLTTAVLNEMYECLLNARSAADNLKLTLDEIDAEKKEES